MNTLYYGDNLKILREYIKDESVDLVYRDPPFNSNRNYNVLFRNESGSDSESGRRGSIRGPSGIIEGTTTLVLRRRNFRTLLVRSFANLQ